jgi:hypothetical protein
VGRIRERTGVRQLAAKIQSADEAEGFPERQAAIPEPLSQFECGGFPQE